MPIYAQHFTRQNFNFTPPLQEEVCVVFETDIDVDKESDQEESEKLEGMAWDALWGQYPLWTCPYSQGNPPPNDLKKWRHSFSSACPHGPLIRLNPGRPSFNAPYAQFRDPRKKAGRAMTSRAILVELEFSHTVKEADPLVGAIRMLRGVEKATLQ